jgi:hypothetical protein
MFSSSFLLFDQSGTRRLGGAVAEVERKLAWLQSSYRRTHAGSAKHPMGCGILCSRSPNSAWPLEARK